MYWVILMTILILQWNAQSLISIGQEFKKFIENCRVRPDVVSSAEAKRMVMGQLGVIEKIGGGCITFVKEGIPYRVMVIGKELEYAVVEVWVGRKKIVIVRYYNPCKRMELNKLGKIKGQKGSGIVWCGDFKTHNNLWGSERTDVNGQVIEALLDERTWICLNGNSSITRIDINTGKESALDLTVVSNSTHM